MSFPMFHCLNCNTDCPEKTRIFIEQYKITQSLLFPDASFLTEYSLYRKQESAEIGKSKSKVLHLALVIIWCLNFAMNVFVEFTI